MSDVSAFSTKNRRVGFSNEKLTCRLYQRKIGVSAFPTKNRRVGFSSGKSTCRLFPLGQRYTVRAERAENPRAAPLLTHSGGVVGTLAALSLPLILSLGDRYAMYVTIAVRMLACYTHYVLYARAGLLQYVFNLFS